MTDLEVIHLCAFVEAFAGVLIQVFCIKVSYTRLSLFFCILNILAASNDLSGEIPSELGRLTELTGLFLRKQNVEQLMKVFYPLRRNAILWGVLGSPIISLSAFLPFFLKISSP